MGLLRCVGIRGVVYGGRDIGVVSMVLTLGWGGGTWVFGVSLFDVFLLLFGVIVLGGGFCLRFPLYVCVFVFVCICVAWRKFSD